MHEATERLYKVVKAARKISGQTAVARLLGMETPQVVKNWETRGISAEGALAAQAAIGCDANWVLHGTGSMFAGWPFEDVSLPRVLAVLPEYRLYLEGSLNQALRDCETRRTGGKDALDEHSVRVDVDQEAKKKKRSR